MIDRTKRVLTIILLLLITASAFIGFSSLAPMQRDQEDGLAEADPLIPDLEFPTMTLGAEGSLSSDSILGFAETLTSDVGLDPDSDTNADAVYSEWDFSESVDPDTWYYPDPIGGVSVAGATGRGLMGLAGTGSGDYTATHTDDSTYYRHYWIPPGTFFDAYIYVNFTGIPYQDNTDWKLHVNAVYQVFRSSGTAGTVDVSVETMEKYLGYWQGQDEIKFHNDITDTGWQTIDETITVSSDAFHDGTLTIGVSIFGSASGDRWEILFDYCHIEIVPADGYTESFQDVSDWTKEASVESFASDGDVVTLEAHGEGDNDYEYVICDSTAFDINGYLEWRYKTNDTVADYVQIRIFDDSGNFYYDTWSEVTSWTTSKVHIKSTMTLSGSDFDTADYIYIALRIDNGLDESLSIDYLRIGSVMGWAHDMSTTEGIAPSGSPWTITPTSDGDIVTVQYNRTAVNNDYGNCKLEFDNTATKIDLETDYYTWVETRFRITAYDAQLMSFSIRVDSKSMGNYYTSTTDWITLRKNVDEMSASSGVYVDFYCYESADDTTPSMTIEIDYVRFYGFNNWTYSDSGTNSKTSSVAYYDSGEDALVIEKAFDTSGDYIHLLTRNTSIGYAIADMVTILTVKASANTSCRLRAYHDYSSGADSDYYYLYDDYQTIAISLTTSSVTLNSLKLSIYDWSSASPSSGTHSIYIKNNVTIRPSWYDASGESGTWADSMADVDDWTHGSGYCDMTTDGDMVTITSNGASGRQVISNTFTPVPSAGAYIEMSVVQGTAGDFRIVIYDGTNWRQLWSGNGYKSNWGTTKTYIESAVDWDGSAVEQVRIDVYTATQTVLFDYMRIAAGTEMGWQEDFDTLNWKPEGANIPDSYATDGDILEVYDTGANGIMIYYDANVKADDYPLCEVRVKGSGNTYIRIYDEDSGSHTMTLTTSTSWTTVRFNLHTFLSSGDYVDDIWIWDEGTNRDYWLDYIKFYFIANYSYASHASVATDEYIYVDDSGAIHFVRSTTNWMGLYHDPALSIATATYNVWNITSDDIDPRGDATSFAFQAIVGGESESHTDESRGSWDGTGSLTDFNFVNYGGNHWISEIKFWEDSNPPSLEDPTIYPTSPTDADTISITCISTDLMIPWTSTFDMLEYPAGQGDTSVSGEAVVIDGITVIWRASWNEPLAGNYTVRVSVWDGANTAYEYLAFFIKEDTLDIKDIVITGTEPTSDWMVMSFYCNKPADFTVHEDHNVSALPSGSVDAGWDSITWGKTNYEGKTSFGIKFVYSGDTEWVNGSYTVSAASPEANLSISYWDMSWLTYTVTIDYWTNWGNTTCKLYVDTVYDSEGSEPDTLSYTLPTSPASYNLTWLIDGGGQTVSKQYNYTVAAPAADAELALTVWDIEKGDYYWYVTWQSNWGNTTITPYEDSVPASGTTENYTLQYEKSTATGNHSLDFKIDGGGSIIWKNYSYFISEAAGLSVDWNFGVTDETVFITGYKNYGTTYVVYEDEVEISSGSIASLSFWLEWTRRETSTPVTVDVAVKFVNETTTIWANWSYTEAQLLVFAVETWWMSLHLGTESYVEFYVLTSWENATVYVYDNETLATTVTESEGGVYSYFWMSETQGLHVVVLNITHGGTVHTRSRTYYIPDWAVTGLVVRWDLWTFQNNYTMITLESNWRNCTFYVYLNSSLVATSYNDPVTLNFTRSINNGTYNLTIYADGGVSTYTIKNIRYIVTEEGVSYDFSSFTGGLTIVEGDTYLGDTGDTYENPTGVFIDQGTAAVVSVGGFLIIFVAYLVARELKQRDREKTERTYSQ